MARKASITAKAALLARTPKNVCGNTQVVHNPKYGYYELLLFGLPILRIKETPSRPDIDPLKEVEFSLNGSPSDTTKERINAFGAQIYRKEGILYRGGKPIPSVGWFPVISQDMEDF